MRNLLADAGDSDRLMGDEEEGLSEEPAVAEAGGGVEGDSKAGDDGA